MSESDPWRKIRRDVLDLTSKLAGGLRNLERHGSVVKSAKVKADRRTKALKKDEDRKANFAKYDLDKDGKLNRKEVEAYCKAVIDYQLTKDVLDKILKALEPLTFEKFRTMHQRVSIAKSEILAREKRAEAEAKAKIIEEQKRAAQEIFDEALKIIQASETTAGEAEGKARPLLKDLQMGAAEMKAAANEVEELMKRVEEELKQSEAKLKAGNTECESKEELKDIAEQATARLGRIETRVQGRLQKLAAALKIARDKATRKEFAEIDGKRAECVTAIRAKLAEDGKTGEQLFEDIGSGKALSQDAFIAFVKKLSGFDLADGEGENLFSHIVGEETEIVKDRFLELVRLFYKCVKATVIAEEISIKSKTVRRLDVGEVLEVLEGPTTEEGSDIQRVKCKSTQDQATGWVTLCGNQGTPFLEPGGNFYTCVKETLITDGLSVQDSKTVRRINKGEVVEVLEFHKKDESADVQRIKGKAKSDGAQGWITVCSGSGTAFLEPC
eukprot:TRINITY_DN10033_c1_g1_i2.p1 TRINITY_DN10033_c1_g1~~TRINITY_DN10033_c1_g1_i2.p1  ORF type:complete len:586 (-),score=170.43 TRINITY_DN10033_c1_g1_i2:92-1588(-)